MTITLPAKITQPAAGKVAGAHGAQHVDLYRKLLLRRKLLALANDGAAYVPFIGDGDIAAEVYSDRKIYGADLDDQRVAVAATRFPASTIKQADCDGWPFPKCTARFAVADFDSYAYPYNSFRSFWTNARKADRLVLYFTDGQKQAIKRTGNWHLPDDRHAFIADKSERRLVYNMYLMKFIKPWFESEISGWRIVRMMSYLRKDMLYWGAVIDKT